MQKIRSVRIDTVADLTSCQHSERSWALSCAQDASHYRWHLTISDTDRPFEQNTEEITVGSVKYDLKPDNSWQAHPYAAGISSASATSGRLAQGTDTQTMPDLATVIRRAVS